MFYLLLASSALFAFGDPDFSDDCTFVISFLADTFKLMLRHRETIPCQIESLYTYNFLSFRFPSKVVSGVMSNS